VTAGEGIEGRPQGRFVQCGADTASEDVVVDSPFGAVGGVEQHARLQFDEGVGVLDVFGQLLSVLFADQLEGLERPDGSFGRVVEAEGGQLADGRLGEQFGQGEVELGGSRPGEDLDTSDGVSAECEVVVQCSDAIDVEYFLKHVGQLEFGIAFGRDVGLLELGPVAGSGQGQPLAVGLPAGCQRKFFELGEAGRDHVGGQGLGQLFSQGLDRRQFLFWLSNQVGGQAEAALDLDGRAGRFGDCLHGAQRRFDIAQFDPIAADLHLAVESPQVLEGAIG
jgi:hypothetical protein